MKLSKERRSGQAEKGSKFHLQNLINENPELLNKLILDTNSSLRAAIGGNIKWLSPLEKENYLEYQDMEFLEAIGYPQLNKNLLEFWPEGGPVWDALATLSLKRSNKNGIILLEAKSHIKELESNGCGAKGKSRDIIMGSLGEVQKSIGVAPNTNWLGKYYQYANRLAHLYFLLVIQKIPSWLVFLYFVGDTEQNGPAKQEAWYSTLEEVKENLGLPEKHILSDNVINIFFDLTTATSQI